LFCFVLFVVIVVIFGLVLVCLFVCFVGGGGFLRGCTSGGVYVPCKSYRRLLRSLLLYLCYVFRALINSLGVDLYIVMDIIFLFLIINFIKFFFNFFLIFFQS